MTHLDSDFLHGVIGGKARPASPTLVTECWHLAEGSEDYARWGDPKASYYKRAANKVLGPLSRDSDEVLM